MRSTHGRLPGPTIFREDTVHHGMAAGSVTVVSGVSLHFYGMIAGDLNIEPQATADIHGLVAGSVVNRGSLTVQGRIAGSVDDTGGETVIRSDASHS
jgi:cytoskeletal protein CcmA (bactofilin family)